MLKYFSAIMRRRPRRSAGYPHPLRQISWREPAGAPPVRTSSSELQAQPMAHRPSPYWFIMADSSLLAVARLASASQQLRSQRHKHVLLITMAMTPAPSPS